jgi:DNA-binding SARP family transcriptional activator
MKKVAYWSGIVCAVRERLASLAEREGRLSDALEQWRALATLDPLDARHALAFMRALAAE